jgi:hypothetical protein
MWDNFSHLVFAWQSLGEWTSRLRSMAYGV